VVSDSDLQYLQDCAHIPTLLPSEGKRYNTHCFVRVVALAKDAALWWDKDGPAQAGAAVG
jgi:hypothetical protein